MSEEVRPETGGTSPPPGGGRSSPHPSLTSVDSVSFEYGADEDTTTITRSESTDSDLGINDSITNYSLFTHALYNMTVTMVTYLWEAAWGLWNILVTSPAEGEGEEGVGEKDGASTVTGASKEGQEESIAKVSIR